MEKVAFIGGYDKTDLLFYAAKLIKTMGKSVIIVDTTAQQKAKYIIPNIAPASCYITTSDTVDFAIGFHEINQLRSYLSADNQELNYDYMFVDIDSYDAYRAFEFMPQDQHYLVTSFDIYSVKKAVEALMAIELKTPITKVYFSRKFSEEEDRYLRLLTRGCSITYRKEPILFPYNLSDTEAIQKNQRDNMIRYRSLSNDYLRQLVNLTEMISGESSGNIKMALRQINR